MIIAECKVRITNVSFHQGNLMNDLLSLYDADPNFFSWNHFLINSANAVSPNHVVCDVNFWYHRQLNHQQEASPRNFNQS